MKRRRRLILLLGILVLGIGISAWVNLPPWLLRRRAAEHYRQGLAFEREGRSDRALAEWRIAGDIDRDYPEPYRKLGDFLLNRADRPDLAGLSDISVETSFRTILRNIVHGAVDSSPEHAFYK